MFSCFLFNYWPPGLKPLMDHKWLHYNPQRIYSYYSIYNSQLEDTLKNTSSLPLPGFEPRTSSCGTRK